MRSELFSEVLTGTSEEYELKKGKKEEYQQNKLFKDKLEESLKRISSNFEKLEDYIVHPIELSTALHVNGLNIKHLSKIYSNVTNNFMREILKT